MTTLNLGSEPTAEPAAPTEPTAAPTAEPAPAPAPVAADWKDSLDEDIRNDPSMSYIKDIPSLAKSYVNAQKQMGADKFIVPGKHATNDDWKNVFHKLGLPETPEKYEIESPKDIEVNKEFLTNFKQKAHELGLLPKQVQELFNWNNQLSKDVTTKQSQAEQERINKEVSQLRSEWGEAEKRNLTIAQVATEEVEKKVPGLKDFLDRTGLGNEPHFIRLMHEFGKNFMEDKLKNNDTLNGFSDLSTDKASARLTEIYANTAYYDKTNPQQKLLVQEASKLNTLLAEAKNPTPKGTTGLDTWR
jgi:hypothetical protein